MFKGGPVQGGKILFDSDTLLCYYNKKVFSFLGIPMMHWRILARKPSPESVTSVEKVFYLLSYEA